MVILTVQASAALGEAQYTVTDLWPGQANGINSIGQVVGYEEWVDTNGNLCSSAYLYSSGTKTDLNCLAGGMYLFSGLRAGW
jgi:probable HAF family extracellular repeat protein